MNSKIPVLTNNGLTPDEERTILRAAREARRGKNITYPMHTQEAVAYLLDYKRDSTL